MNEENLISLADRTTEEQRKIAKMGGIASGESRRKRKAFKDALLLALETEKDGKTIQDIGIEALMQKYMTGDLQAFTTVRDTVGEKPKEVVENTIVRDIKVDVVDE